MNKSKKISKILIMCIMLISVATILAGCGKKKEEKIEAYEEPVKNMIEGMQNTNLEQYKKAFPEFINNQVTQKTLDEMMGVYIQMYGQDIKISYKINSKEEVSDSKLSEIKENIKIYYKKECSVTKGYRLEIDRTIAGMNNQETTGMSINVYEIDGQWYALTF